MACPVTLANHTVDCLDSMGGVRTVYFCKYDALETPTVADGVITALQLKDTEKFYIFECTKETCSMTSTRVVNTTSGNNYATVELSLSLKKMTKESRLWMENTAKGPVIAIVVDQNDDPSSRSAWFLGFSNPLTASAGSGTTGTAFSDSNEFTVTFSCSEKQYPYPLSQTAMEYVEDNVHA